LVPLAGSAESAKIKDLSGELSREGLIEAIDEISVDVPPPLEHSVYVRPQLPGRHARIAPDLYVAFDADNRPLGEFERRGAAYAGVAHGSDEGGPQ
jgi:hypothetical protein